MSAQHLASLTGIPRVSLSKMENGSRGIRLSEAVAICAVLDASLEAMCAPEPILLRLETQID